MADRLRELSQQRARLEQRAAELRTRERELGRQARTRRLILIGSIVSKAVETDQRARDWLVNCLRKAVNDRDRHMFGDLLSGDGGDGGDA